MDESADEFYIVDRDALVYPGSDDSEDKSLEPPLHNLLEASEPILKADAKLTIIAHLDKINPLTEARWVRSSEPNAWAFVAPQPSKGTLPPSLADSAWVDKLHVTDPDPPPTFNDIISAWIEQRAESNKDHLRAFVAEQFADVANVVELMLCLIRGGDLAPSNSMHRKEHHARAPSVVTTELGARAMRMGAPYPSDQTSLSLATFAMFKLAIDNGAKAGVAKKELDNQVSEIVRQIPSVMLYKAVDVQYRSWNDKRRSAK